MERLTTVLRLLGLWLLHPVQGGRRLVAALRLLDAVSATSAVVWRAWDRVPVLLIDLSEGGGLRGVGLSGGQVAGADLRTMLGVDPDVMAACERVLRTGREATVVVNARRDALGFSHDPSTRQYLTQVSRCGSPGRWGVVCVAFDVTGLTDELADALTALDDAHARIDEIATQAQRLRLAADLATRERDALIAQRTAERRLADALHAAVSPC